jgi:hypothetical protein
MPRGADAFGVQERYRHPQNVGDFASVVIVSRRRPVGQLLQPSGQQFELLVCAQLWRRSMQTFLATLGMASVSLPRWAGCAPSRSQDVAPARLPHAGCEVLHTSLAK